MSVPDNSRLVQAIHDLLDGSIETHFRPALDALLASTLISGDDDGEPSTIDGDEEDETLLALFTDLIELHMFAPGSSWTAIRGEDAIRRVADDEYDGLIVNPRGRALQLSREDVLELFDIEG